MACSETQLSRETGIPTVEPLVPETMQAYYKRLQDKVDTSIFKVVDTIEEDGLYIGKRAIRGATGQEDLLNQAGTVFYHNVLYIRASSRTTALDYSPQGSVDVTANLMEAVPCGPLLHEDATPDPGNPLVLVQHPYKSLQDTIFQKAMKFAESRKYHAISNNCIQNTDFFCRILTGGRVKNAPMIYDLVAGKVPEQDHPMLLMFFLMTGLSWFTTCDGSKLTTAFLEAEGLQTAEASSTQNGGKKPAAQSRLEEQQVDLMQLVQSLGSAAGTNPEAQPKPS